MKLFIFYFYINGLIMYSSGGHSKKVGTGAGVNLKLKPVMCAYFSPGPNGLNDRTIPAIEPQNIPNACQMILFFPVFIDTDSTITCDTDSLQQLSLVKPVILGVKRINTYSDWVQILTPQGNQKDVNALVNFAQQFNILGFEFMDLTPFSLTLTDILNVNVAHYIIPYIKQIKALKPQYIVGLNLDISPPILKNPCITDFDQLNGIVDYYEMDTAGLSNYCQPTKYNGFTPLHKRKPGLNYIMSLEEAINNIRLTKCDLSKVYIIVEMIPYNNDGNSNYYTYNEVCNTRNVSDWCIQNTNDLFQKGKYVKQQHFGLSIESINLDNTDNACGCSFFTGVTNIIAGYRGGQHTPCPKYDVMKSMESY